MLQESESALRALKLQTTQSSSTAASATSAAAAAALSDRTALARKNANLTLSKLELANRVPLVGRALGRMERRQVRSICV